MACHLRSGASVSCHGKAHPTHGRGNLKDRVYAVWCWIKQRCHNPKATGYKDYGGRGIVMHEAWLTDFVAFASELGEPPSDRHTVERIENNRGYVPGNIKWALPVEQARNRRSNRWLVIDGVEACITDWCAFTGVNQSTATNRMRLYGCNPAQAVGLEPLPWQR